MNVDQFVEWANNLLFGKQHEITLDMADILTYWMAKQVVK